MLADPREILLGLAAARDDVIKKWGFQEDTTQPAETGDTRSPFKQSF
jgi:hypothetical protein